MKNIFLALLSFLILLGGFLFTTYISSDRGKTLWEAILEKKTYSDPNTHKKNLSNSTNKATAQKKKKKKKIEEKFAVITAPYSFIYRTASTKSHPITTLFRGERITIITNIKIRGFIPCKYNKATAYLPKHNAEIFFSKTEYTHFSRSSKRYGYKTKYGCVYNTIKALRKRARGKIIKGIHKKVAIFFMEQRSKTTVSTADWRNLPGNEPIRRRIHGNPYTLNHLFSRAATLRYYRNRIPNKEQQFIYPAKNDIQLRFKKIGNRWFWISLLVWEKPID